MGILLPCDLSTWPSVVSYLNVLASGLDSIQDVIVVLLQIHDLCNISIFNDEDPRPHDEHMFDHLYEVIEHQFSPEDRERFLKKTLPCLARYACALPELKPNKFEYILASRPSKLNLDRKFVASLAANAFMSSLCKKSKKLWPHGLRDVTFETLFPCLSTDFCSAIRFKGFLEYFDILQEEGGPCGRISYELHVNAIRKDTLEEKTDMPTRKSLAPVFIVEEDIRPLDLSANVDRLIIKELDNITDMNLQHPELIPLLIATEPKLKENEWIDVKGLMSRVANTPSQKSEITGQNEDSACVCIVERTSALATEDVKLAQESCFSIMKQCFDVSKEENNDVESSDERSKIAPVSSKLQSCNAELEEESETPSTTSDDDDDDDDDKEDNYKHKPKRQCFADRLKNALERGCTPETPEEHSSFDLKSGSAKVMDRSLNNMVARKRFLSDEDNRKSNNVFDAESPLEESSSFSDDSVYSFESLVASYDMEAGYEDLQLDLMKPFHQDENWKLRCLAITDHLKRMCLSEAYLDICLHLEKCTASLIKPTNFSTRHTKSDNGYSYQPQKFKSNLNENEESASKLPIWIVNHSNEVDSKRFLIEWLSASIQNVPLVVYQSSKTDGSMSGDVIAAICSWIEEQSWTTEELYCSLLQGSVATNEG